MDSTQGNGAAPDSRVKARSLIRVGVAMAGAATVALASRLTGELDELEERHHKISRELLEARNLYLTWQRRAHEAGWVPPADPPAAEDQADAPVEPEPDPVGG